MFAGFRSRWTPQRFVDGDRTLRDAIRQRRAFGQFHDQRTRFARKLDALDSRDVGVISVTRGLWLPAGSGLGARRHGQTVGQHFDGDIPTQIRIAGTINLAHPAGTNSREDFVRAASLLLLQECLPVQHHVEGSLRLAALLGWCEEQELLPVNGVVAAGIVRRLKKELGCSRQESRAGRNANLHDFGIGRQVIQFLSVRAPLWIFAAAIRYLPFGPCAGGVCRARIRRERPDVNLALAGFVRSVSDPLSIARSP
jgi:hypothetical protein